jgi:hypothetical protein
MAGDLIREVRRSVLAHLKKDAALTALVAPASIYPSRTPATPAWPFVRWDGPQSIPIDLSCVAGASVTFLLHGFAKDRKQGAAVVETAEDHAARIGSSLKSAIHNRRIPVEGTTARMTVRSARLIQDGDEADAYHAILSVEARVLAA